MPLSLHDCQLLYAVCFLSSKTDSYLSTEHSRASGDKRGEANGIPAVSGVDDVFFVQYVFAVRADFHVHFPVLRGFEAESGRTVEQTVAFLRQPFVVIVLEIDF